MSITLYLYTNVPGAAGGGITTAFFTLSLSAVFGASFSANTDTMSSAKPNLWGKKTKTKRRDYSQV